MNARAERYCWPSRASGQKVEQVVIREREGSPDYYNNDDMIYLVIECFSAM